MAGKSTITKKDAKTRKAIKQGLLNGESERKIAKQTETHPSTIHRYKEKLHKQIVERASEEADETYQMHKEAVNTLNGMALSLKDLYYQWLEDVKNGDEEASKKLQELLAIARELRPMVADLAKMTENIKETADINNRPTVVLAQIAQMIMTSDSKEAMLDWLRNIAN